MIVAVVFWAAALVAVASAVVVFRTDSMARCTYALAVSFVAVGVMLLSFRLDYLGVMVILMMVMEMAVMAVFMVMFMGMNPALMPMDMTHSKRTSAIVAVGSFVTLSVAAFVVPWPIQHRMPTADLVASLGNAIMGSKMLVMLTISPVLFATIVSTVVLANPRGRYDRLGDDLERSPADDPQPGGVGR